MAFLIYFTKNAQANNAGRNLTFAWALVVKQLLHCWKALKTYVQGSRYTFHFTQYMLVVVLTGFANIIDGCVGQKTPIYK